MPASKTHRALAPEEGASEQPLVDLFDGGDASTLPPAALPLEPDRDVGPVAPVDVVVPLPTAPAALEPAVPPTPEVTPLDAVLPLVADRPLLVPDDPVVPAAPVVPPLAPAEAPLALDPLPARPESSATSVPASTGVVEMPVAPQKTRCALLVFVTCTPVSMAVADGVSWMPSMVWPVASTSVSPGFHFPVSVMR